MNLQKPFNSRKKSFFITGIGTGIGKTLVSAIVTAALEADYFKPIQAGSLDDTDTIKIKNLVGPNHAGFFHPEIYRLTHPLSPHASAALDNLTIAPDNLVLPNTKNSLVVEGAGGLFVPLNDTYYVIDLIKKFSLPVLVVSNHYLGSINHTLLTLSALQTKGIAIAGLIFNGNETPASESAIKRFVPTLATYRIPWAEAVSPEFIYGQKNGILPWIKDL